MQVLQDACGTIAATGMCKCTVSRKKHFDISRKLRFARSERQLKESWWSLVGTGVESAVWRGVALGDFHREFPRVAIGIPMTAIKLARDRPTGGVLRRRWRLQVTGC